MRFPIRTILILSLVANLTGGVALVLRPDHAPDPASVLPAPPEDRRDRAAIAESHVQGAAPGLDFADLEDLKRRLQTEFSPGVVEAVLACMADEKYGIPALEAELRKGENPALRAELERRSREVEAELRQLTDIYAHLDAARDRDYAVRYGDLPHETVEGVRELEKANRSTTDREFAELLRPLLTPAEIDEYMRYHSLLAKQIQLDLGSIDVDEATYLALLNRAVEREGSATPDVDPNEAYRRARAPDAVADFRATLGDERFLQIIAGFDPVIASADAVYQVAGLSEAERADLFLEAYAVKADFSDRRSGAASPEEMEQAGRTLHATLVTAARLTPDQIEGFDRMLGIYLRQGKLRWPSGRGAAVRGMQD